MHTREAFLLLGEAVLSGALHIFKTHGVHPFGLVWKQSGAASWVCRSDARAACEWCAGGPAQPLQPTQLQR